MKKSLFTLALVASLVACGKNSESVQAPIENGRKAISFGYAETKAFTELNLDGLKTSGFNVLGLNGSTVLINNETAAYTPASDAFKTSTIHYFPSTGTVDFFAVAPATDLTPGTKNASFAQSTALAGTEDIIASYALDQTGDENGKVSLNFKHILSRIKVLAKCEDTNLVFSIESVKIVGNDKGTYTFASDDEHWTSTDSTEFSVPSVPMAITTEASTLLDDRSVIPAEGKDFSVEITWKAKDGDNVIAQETTKKGFNVAPGKKNTITCVLMKDQSLKEIQFVVTVEDWEEGLDEEFAF